MINRSTIEGMPSRLVLRRPTCRGIYSQPDFTVIAPGGIWYLVYRNELFGGWTTEHKFTAWVHGLTITELERRLHERRERERAHRARMARVPGSRWSTRVE